MKPNPQDRVKPKSQRYPGKKRRAPERQPSVQETLPRLPQPTEGSNGELRIDTVDGGIAFEVHVVPRSAKNRVAGTHGSRLHVKVNAPPIEGAANQAVCATIAKALGIAPRKVSIIQGTGSRLKRVHVEDLSEVEARKAFVF